MNTIKIFLISIALGVVCLICLNKPKEGPRVFTPEEVCNGTCQADGYYTNTGERFCDIEKDCGWVEGFLDYYCPEW